MKNSFIEMALKQAEIKAVEELNIKNQLVKSKESVMSELVKTISDFLTYIDKKYGEFVPKYERYRMEKAEFRRLFNNFGGFKGLHPSMHLYLHVDWYYTSLDCFIDDNLNYKILINRFNQHNQKEFESVDLFMDFIINEVAKTKVHSDKLKEKISLYNSLPKEKSKNFDWSI